MAITLLVASNFLFVLDVFDERVILDAFSRARLSAFVQHVRVISPEPLVIQRSHLHVCKCFSLTLFCPFAAAHLDHLETEFPFPFLDPFILLDAHLLLGHNHLPAAASFPISLEQYPRSSQTHGFRLELLRYGSQVALFKRAPSALLARSKVRDLASKPHQCRASRVAGRIMPAHFCSRTRFGRRDRFLGLSFC